MAAAVALVLAASMALQQPAAREGEERGAPAIRESTKSIQKA